jgi:hypothetical protein
MEPLPDPPG